MTSDLFPSSKFPEPRLRGGPPSSPHIPRLHQELSRGHDEGAELP